MRFHCWNVGCYNYAGAGVRLREGEVIEGLCPGCGRRVVKAPYADFNADLTGVAAIAIAALMVSVTGSVSMGLGAAAAFFVGSILVWVLS